MKKSRNTQAGNALWIILVAVVLIGALTVQLSRSGSTVENTGDRKYNKIEASQVLRYAAAIERAVKNLQLRDCGERMISFENSTDTNYTNANAPADQSCHVFATAGEGLTWRNFGSEVLDTGASMAITGDIALYGQNYGTADTRPELMLIIPVSKSICAEINDQNDLPTSGTTITSNIDGWDDYFTGTYPNSATWELGDAANEAPALNGSPSGCLIDGNGQHVFYYVLIER